MQFFCYGHGFETWRRILLPITTTGLVTLQVVLVGSSGCNVRLLLEFIIFLYPEIGSMLDYIKSAMEPKI